MAMSRTSERTLALWQGLTERQRHSLAVAYHVDQEHEAAERAAWSRGGRAAPVDAWRWLPCVPDWPLHTRLALRDLLDEGTGATFAALGRRRLVDCRHDETALGTTLLVRLTPLGRRVARAGGIAAAIGEGEEGVGPDGR